MVMIIIFTLPSQIFLVGISRADLWKDNVETMMMEFGTIE